MLFRRVDTAAMKSVVKGVHALIEVAQRLVSGGGWQNLLYFASLPIPRPRQRGRQNDSQVHVLYWPIVAKHYEFHCLDTVEPRC